MAQGTLCEEELRFVKIFFENIEMSEDIFFRILRLARIFFLFDIKPFPIPRCL